MKDRPLWRRMRLLTLANLQSHNRIGVFASLVLAALFVTVVAEAEHNSATLPHRCIHSHSHALQSIADNASLLEVEYIRTVDTISDDPTTFARRRFSDRAAAANLTQRRVSTQAAEEESTEVSTKFDPLTLAGYASPFSSTTYPPLRIHFDVSHLFNTSHFCTWIGAQRSDKLGGTVSCGPDDLFSAWKRDFVLHRVLPTLGRSVEQWLRLRDESAAKDAKNGTLRVIVPQGICGPSVDIPLSHTTDGVYNTDFIVYVLAAPLHDTVTTSNARASTAAAAAATTSASTSSRTIAWATYCAVERRTARPLVAVMNFVPSSLVIREARAASAAAAAPPSLLRSALRVVKRMWEFFGFSRDHAESSGTAESRLRSAVYDGSAVLEVFFSQWTTQHARSLLHELLHALGFAPTQLQKYATAVAADALTSRGRATGVETSKAVGAGGKALTTAVITAPKVKAAVQAWMRCTNSKALPGAALEQSGPDGTVGAHWERLQYHDDLMAGVLSPTAALSDMTLAFFDSLPFYRADRRYAEHPMWGYQAGCGFARGACRPVPRFVTFANASATAEASGADAESETDFTTRSKYWCEAASGSSVGHAQCTADRRAIGFCFAQKASSRRVGGSAEGTGATGATAPDAVESRGLSLLMEGCPIIEAYSNRVCDTSTIFESILDSVTAAPNTASQRSSSSSRSSSGSGQRQASTSAADVRYRHSVLMDDQSYYFGPYSRCFATSDVHRLDRFTQRAAEPIMSPSRSVNASSSTGPIAASNGGAWEWPVDSRRVESLKRVAATLVSARCLQTRCVKGGTAVELRVGAVWVQCPADGSAGVVSIPPASGYTGAIGCEAAALYCGDAAQLQPPLQLLNTTPALLPSTSPVVLPLYRVTVTFTLSLLLLPTDDGTAPDVRVNASCGAAGGATAAAEVQAFRRALVNSDAAFGAALQEDLARHRARAQRSPFGAIMAQRVVGAARLACASIAVFDDMEKANKKLDSAHSPANRVDTDFRSNSTRRFPQRWEALVSADVEVAARDAAEALRSTQEWLVDGVGAVPHKTEGVFTGARPAFDAAPLSDIAFSSVAAWLARVRCAAAATAATAVAPCDVQASAAQPNSLGGSGNSLSLNDGAAAAALTLTSPSLLPIEAIVAQFQTHLPDACVARTPARQLPPTWEVLARGRCASFSVVGPLDVSEQKRGAGDLREVAIIHFRIRLHDNTDGDEAAGDEKSEEHKPSTRTSCAKLDKAEEWVSQSVALLALTKDVSAMLGLSPQLVRVASIRHPAALPLLPLGSIDVGFVMSLPAVEAVPWWAEFGDEGATPDNATTAPSSAAPRRRPQTWTAFTGVVRATWQRQLSANLLRPEAAQTTGPCLLHHASILRREQQQQQPPQSAVDRTRSPSTAVAHNVACLVELEAVVSVHAPRPGVSPEDFLLGANVEVAQPWWKRRVMVVRGFAATSAMLLGSVLVTVLLIFCAIRHGGK